MAKTFRPYEPDQMLLMPPSLADWVPEDHLARFVRDVVDTLDLTAIEATYTEERGYPPYHPRMMAAVLLYAYATGPTRPEDRPAAGGRRGDAAPRHGNQPDFRT
jgi:transposase